MRTIKILLPERLKYGEFCDFRGEIYKILIDMPFLWGIFDMEIAKFPNPPNDMTTLQAKATLDAFCNFLLHNFRTFIMYSPFKLTGGMKSEYRKVWENYMIHLMVSSTPFRQIVEKELEGQINNPRYQKRMKVLLEIAMQVLVEKRGS